jgi:hypothetical protein
LQDEKVILICNEGSIERNFLAKPSVFRQVRTNDTGLILPKKIDWEEVRKDHVKELRDELLKHVEGGNQTEDGEIDGIYSI